MSVLDKYKNKYRIPSNRLNGWDYSANGYYFVTICTRDRVCYFGDVKNEKMILSDLGKIVEKYWEEIPKHFPQVILDEYRVMPNHVHGIVVIDWNNDKLREFNWCPRVETQNIASLRAGIKPRKREYPTATGQWQQNKFGPQSKNLGSIIRGFKSGVTTWARKNDMQFTWQSRYYDCIVRNEKDLVTVREYVHNNPKNWKKDCYYPLGG